MAYPQPAATLLNGVKEAMTARDIAHKAMLFDHGNQVAVLLYKGNADEAVHHTARHFGSQTPVDDIMSWAMEWQKK